MISKYKHVPHNRPTLGQEEKEAALRVIESGQLSQGREVENLENEFCDYLGISRGLAVAVSSGTAALFLSLLSLEADGKTVSIPGYTCSALRNAAVMAGATPFLIDSREDSPNMNLFDVQHADISIVPHMFGIPQEIPDQKTLIIEDCAQALGANVQGIPAGLQGDIGFFSFYATKLITAGGQGGMVVSRDRSMIDFMKDYRLFDQRKDEKHRFNFQMTDLQAAIGRVQLRKLPGFLKRREEIYLKYKEAGFPLLDSKEGITPVRFRAILRTEKQYEVINALKQERIKAVIPLQEWELFGSKETLPNAYRWTQNTVSLPLYPTLKVEETDRVIAVVSDALQ
ncbi:MAG: DegT/DnrJ/EryC1/StrS family aminotransferase [Bacillus sp. (in: firmicutes)]